MSNLLVDRACQSTPFKNVDADFFGPFFVRNRPSIVKRYNVVFTCIYSRAIHIEIFTDMTSDSFILALHCCIAICGPVLFIWCDSGTYCVGACNEVKASQFYGKNPIK